MLNILFIIAIAVLALQLLILVAVLLYGSGLLKKHIGSKKIKKESWLYLSFPHGLTERPENKFSFSNLRLNDIVRSKTVLSDVLLKIKTASEDAKFSGIILNLDKWDIDDEHTTEITEAVEIFKKQGKKVYAYASALCMSNYLAAVSADEIFLDPSDPSGIVIKAPGALVPYFKEAGDKIGIEADVIHIGKHKGSGENFIKSTMSEEYRNSVIKPMENLTGIFAGKVSKSRGFLKDDFASRLKNGDFVFINPQSAVEEKLADRLSTFDEMLEKIGAKKDNLVKLEDYRSLKAKKKAAKIAVVCAEGIISDDKASGLISGSKIRHDKIRSDFEKIKKDKKIKAVVLRVNSPGGSASESDKIYKEITELKKKVPVIGSAGPVSASGGYYILCACSKIIAHPLSVTGSVGVVSLLPNFSRITKKTGINIETVSRGRYSDLFSPFKKDRDDDLCVLKKAMEAVYKKFKQRVSEGRKITAEKTEELAQGQIWTGEEAVEKGLADDAGGLLKAIETAARTAGVEKYSVITYPEKKTMLERLTETEKDEVDILGMVRSIKLQAAFSDRPAALLAGLTLYKK